MLRTVRKFSSSPIAKIFLAIIILPFIFWGMGPVFQGGKLNVIVEIGKEKVSTDEFIKFIDYNAPNPDYTTWEKNLIEKLLSNFISEKLIAQEIENFEINLSDSSLSKIIRNENIFKKNNEFSRVEYEKFLLKNNFNAITFEANVSRQSKKEQFFNLIGGGIIPPDFLINNVYNNIQQKRKVELINLNNFFNEKINITNDEMQLYYDNNKEKFISTYKFINFINFDSKSLVGGEEYNDIFFKKVDEIDDLIVNGKNLNFIVKKYNLPSPTEIGFNKSAEDINLDIIKNFPQELVLKAFDISEEDPVLLIEEKSKYYIVELIETKDIQNKINNNKVKKEILFNLEKVIKQKLISELIAKVNKNEFNKTDFVNFAKERNIDISKISLNNRNDDKELKKDLVDQIYSFPKKQIVVIADVNLLESYLIDIDEIENVQINKDSDVFGKYANLSQVMIKNNLFSSYDAYLRKRYKIKINYKALDKVNNYFK